MAGPNIDLNQLDKPLSLVVAIVVIAAFVGGFPQLFQDFVLSWFPNLTSSTKELVTSVSTWVFSLYLFLALSGKSLFGVIGLRK